MSAVAMAFAVLLAAAAGAKAPREDCDAIYEGIGRAKEHARALACFRASKNWMWVAIMQLNGEGTPVDVAGARATLDAAEGPGLEQPGDLSALDDIITAREKDPKAK